MINFKTLYFRNFKFHIRLKDHKINYKQINKKY